MNHVSDQPARPILIVEDDDALRALLVRILELAGHGTVAVDDADQAIAQLARGSFGAIVLDNGLPGMTGCELLAYLRTREPPELLPAVLVTGDALLSTRALWLELGAPDYLTKPFEPDELVARVEAALSVRSAVKTAG
jgi:DNA-binding response OmpR family regulator